MSDGLIISITAAVFTTVAIAVGCWLIKWRQWKPSQRDDHLSSASPATSCSDQNQEAIRRERKDGESGEVSSDPSKIVEAVNDDRTECEG